MKPIYLILLKKMLVSFRFYFFFLVFMSLGVAATFDVKRMPDPSTTPLFQLYYEFLSVKIMVYMIFPFFLILNGIISDLFDRSNVLLQYNHQGTWWKDKVFSVVLFSIVFSLVINMAILVAIILSGNLMKIGIHFVSYMLLGTVMQLVGFLMVGMVYHLFVLKWEKKYFGFFATILIFVSFEVSKSILKMNYPTLEGFMVLENKMRLKNHIIVLSDFVPLLLLLFTLATLYLLGILILKHKDFYWSE